MSRRRWLRIVVPALVLLLFAAVTVSVWVLTTMPSYTAEALTRALDRKVEVGDIDVRLGLRLQVEVRGLRVHETLEASERPLLEAPVARGRQSWPRLLLGQLVPLDWELEDPVARVSLGDAPRGELPDLPLRSIRAVRAQVELDAGSRGRFKLDQLSFELGQRALLPGYSGKAAGRVSDSKGAIGRADVTFQLTDDYTEISGQVAGVALSRVRPYVELGDRVRWIRGRVDGRFSVAWGADQLSGSGDLALRKLSVKLDGMEEPFETETLRLAGELSRDGARWNLAPNPLGIESFSMSGSLGIDTSPNGRITANLAIADFSIASPSEGEAKPINVLSLLGLRIKGLRQLEQRIAAGTFEEANVRIDLPTAELAEALALRRPLTSDQLSVGISLRDAVLTNPNGTPPLESVSGRVEIVGDRFLLQALSLSRQGRRYPTVNLELDGLSTYVHLPQEERQMPRGPGVSLPGLGPAFRALRRDDGKRDPKSPPRPELAIDFQDLWIGYPAFFFQIREAEGTLRFPEGALVVDRARAVVAGGLADVSVRWRYEPDLIDVKIAYVDGVAPRQSVRPAQRWIQGSFAIGSLPIGSWVFDELTGHIQAHAGEIRFDRLLAELGGGRLQGSGQLDLTRDGVAPIHFDLDVNAADAAEATAFMNMGDARVTGTASAKLEVGGALDPSQRFLATSEVRADVDFSDGTLVNMPVAMQIARLPSLEGFRALFGQALPYDTLRGRVLLRGGVLALEDFSMMGPQLRALLAGEVDLNTEQRESDLVVAFLFLQTLDRVIGKVPLVGDMLLGADGSLVSLSFRVRGPVANPSVLPAAPETLQSAADWTGGWLRRMREMIPGLRGKGGSEETPAPSAPEPRGEPPSTQAQRGEPDGQASDEREPQAEEPHEGAR